MPKQCREIADIERPVIRAQWERSICRKPVQCLVMYKRRSSSTHEHPLRSRLLNADPAAWHRVLIASREARPRPGAVRANESFWRA